MGDNSVTPIAESAAHAARAIALKISTIKSTQATAPPIFLGGEFTDFDSSKEFLFSPIAALHSQTAQICPRVMGSPQFLFGPPFCAVPPNAGLVGDPVVLARQTTISRAPTSNSQGPAVFEVEPVVEYGDAEVLRQCEQFRNFQPTVHLRTSESVAIQVRCSIPISSFLNCGFYSPLVRIPKTFVLFSLVSLQWHFHCRRANQRFTC